MSKNQYRCCHAVKNECKLRRKRGRDIHYRLTKSEMHTLSWACAHSIRCKLREDLLWHTCNRSSLWCKSKQYSLAWAFPFSLQWLCHLSRVSTSIIWILPGCQWGCKNMPDDTLAKGTILQCDRRVSCNVVWGTNSLNWCLSSTKGWRIICFCAGFSSSLWSQRAKPKGPMEVAISLADSNQWTCSTGEFGLVAKQKGKGAQSKMGPLAPQSPLQTFPHD